MEAVKTELDLNMNTWNRLNKPPLKALRQISAGRLKGKTDINPQWRMQAMTEVFGPVGVGWKYTIDKLWAETGAENQVCAFALVSVFTKTANGWSEPIPGIGGSMLIVQEKSGLHTSDEAYKMAVTDALSVALKSLGIAAEIYLGNFDGSKYINQPEVPPAKITKEQADTINSLIKETATEEAKFLKFMGCDTVADILESDYNKAVTPLMSKKAAMKPTRQPGEEG